MVTFTVGYFVSSPLRWRAALVAATFGGVHAEAQGAGIRLQRSRIVKISLALGSIGQAAPRSC